MNWSPSFETNNYRRIRFDQERKINRAEAIEKYSYFDLDKTLFGALELDLKVVDTGGLPSMGPTNISYRYGVSPAVGTATHSKTLIFNPSLTDQNTYEWQWWYIIPQNSTNEFDDDFRRMAARVAASTVLALAENLPKIVDKASVTGAQEVE